MSRIGKYPVILDEKVNAEIKENVVTIKGVKSAISYNIDKSIKVAIDNKKLILTRSDDSSKSRSLHGLYKVLLQNAVVGVTKGFTKSLELHGVGYRAAVTGSKLELSLGFSHPINFEIPAGIEIKVEKQTTVSVTGSDKSQVGQIAAKIRSFRPPEPYLGKGVRYAGEVLRRKAGKSAGK